MYGAEALPLMSDHLRLSSTITKTDWIWPTGKPLPAGGGGGGGGGGGLGGGGPDVGGGAITVNVYVLSAVHPRASVADTITENPDGAAVKLPVNAPVEGRPGGFEANAYGGAPPVAVNVT